MGASAGGGCRAPEANPLGNIQRVAAAAEEEQGGAMGGRDARAHDRPPDALANSCGECLVLVPSISVRVISPGGGLSPLFEYQVPGRLSFLRGDASSGRSPCLQRVY